MSSIYLTDLPSEQELGSVVGMPRSKGNGKTKTRRLCKGSPGQGLKDGKWSNDTGVLDQNPPVDKYSAAPICRQFWKAGNHSIKENDKLPIKNGKSHLHVHPLFLHSNATSHKWAFGAIAELLDNAIDEIQNGATYVLIDKIINPRDGSPALLIKDDGGGMDPSVIRRCMSFGFTDKRLKAGIGQYGNGFKTSSMRLGADVIVFTSHSDTRKLTRSVGLLSYTFLIQSGFDRIVVPMVDYEFDASGTLKPMLSHGSQHFSSNLTVLLQWSPYSTEKSLLNQFDDIGDHGTQIIIYNLWLNGDGSLELDFASDDEDIRINADAKLIQTHQHSKPVFDQHIANIHRYSLRVYASILYLRLPLSFRIVLRGREVEHHNIANDLKHLEFILYRPKFGGNKEAAVITTIGFLKDAPFVNIHGFNVYHRNRLILPFWHVVKTTTGSHGRGVVGILEANFVEPTHNKQDFEKTSLFQRLEDRLREMASEYWHCYCGLVGYLPQRRRPSPLEPMLLNSNFSDDARTASPHLKGWGLKKKRKEKNHAGSDFHEKDVQHYQVEQASNYTSDSKFQLAKEEMTNLMQENRELLLQLSEWQAREECLSVRVQQLRNELDEVQNQYAMLLAELESGKQNQILHYRGG